MDDLKPKRSLDKDMLRRAINYYRLEFTDEDYDKFENWECFSHPSLELHDCNARVKLPGNRVCEFCNHNVDKPCDTSCDFQTFCLAVYAWRLGIGGTEFDKALQSNLFKKSPSQLYDEVILNLSGVDVSLTESEESMIDEQDEVVEEGTTEKYYTVAEAAKLKGCSYATIYNAITKEKLEYEDRESRKMISESVLKEFKTNSRKGSTRSVPTKVKRKVRK